MTKPLRILLTNDDGYQAEGIKKIYRQLAAIHDVIVVAPKTGKSGIGHAFTYTSTIRCTALDGNDGMKGFSVDGSPADCVKLALAHLLGKKPDLVVSGINSGENAGLAGFYSGTVAGAREACFWGVPAVAFSCAEDATGKCFWEYTETASKICERIAGLKMKNATDGGQRIFYNVNFPACPLSMCAGIRVCRQGLTFYDDRYLLESEEGQNSVFRLEGGRLPVEKDSVFDARAIAENIISVSPLMFDATAHEAITELTREFLTVSI
jgi:5'-nucleotidase